MSRASLPLDFRNTNSLWAGVLVETLARLGVRQAVISPGSRSTPLTVQFARHPAIEAIPVLDERSAAFFALGLAKRTGGPVVLLCTSGTAGANYFPAVIEAQESGVPLLVITADRPPEMRECRSGQTIDQQKLFGGHVNFYHELAVPEPRLDLLRYLRQTVRHAWSRTLAPVAGPVHLNAPFRDPLPPVADATTGKLRRAWRHEEFFAGLEPVAAGVVAPGAVSGTLPAVRRGLVIAGAEGRPPTAAVRGAAALAAAQGWPVLADALSGLRDFAGEIPGMVTRYDTILRNPALAAELAPEAVICLGGWPTSKVLRAALERWQPRTWVVAPSTQNRDALHLRAQPWPGDWAGFRSLPALSPDYVQAWQQAERRADRGLARELARAKGRFEGTVAASLAGWLPPGTPVLVANSMPVRDAEYFWPANDRGTLVYCNRGANGIDGTLSTALGLAHGGPPAVLLTGDLALLHDANGFLSAPRLRGSLTIVLINNAGGGIFEHLPIAAFEPPFEDFFATPQRADFARLAAAHGIEHHRIRRWSELAARLRRLPSRGVRLLEVGTDRKRDAAFRRAVFARVAAGLR